MLTLRSTAKVTKIKKPSSSACFSDLQVGDIIEFSIPITRLDHYGNSSLTKVAKILCHNCRTDKESALGFNRLCTVLECCCLKEIYFTNTISKRGRHGAT